MGDIVVEKIPSAKNWTDPFFSKLNESFHQDIHRVNL